MEKESFAERLKRLRIERKYTQRQLSGITKISVQSIRNYEQGKNEPVSAYLLELAKALDITPEYLLKGDNDMNNYTEAIKSELMQLTEFDEISEIKNEELNSTILSHLEMSEELVSAIKNEWNGKDIFKRKNKENGTIEDSYCTRNYVQEVLIRYCQNRTKYKQKFNIKDGMILNSEES